MDYTKFNPEDYEKDMPLLWWEKVLGIIITLVILYVPFFAPKFLGVEVWGSIRDITIGFVMCIIYTSYRSALYKYRKKK